MDIFTEVFKFWLNYPLISKNSPKNSQNCHMPSFSCFGTGFFGTAVWFYIEMTFHLIFHWFYLATIRDFVNLPKFAQIPYWWRHTGSCVCFQISKPTFLDSAMIFTLEKVQHHCLATIIPIYKPFSLSRYTSQICSLLAKVPQMTSHIVMKYFFYKQSFFETTKKHDFQMLITSSKRNIFWRGFFWSFRNYELFVTNE